MQGKTTMTKTAWTDNNYEGKALRRVFTRLLVRFEKEIKKDDVDLEVLEKVSRTLSLLAKEKGHLAKEELDMIRRIKELEKRLPSTIKRGTILDGVQETYKDMPKFPN